MFSFKTFLLEMTIQDAETLLGLESGWDVSALDKAYRQLAQTSHPDKGGSTELMTRINSARKILKKSGPSTRSSANRKQERHMLKLQIQHELESKFDLNAFIEYFKNTFNTEFFYKKESSFENSDYYAGIKYTFFNKNRTNVYDLSITANLNDVKLPAKMLGGAASDDISYELSVVSYGYSNKKKVKMSQRDWKRTYHHKVLTDPTVAFPKSKIVKKQTRKFSKRDMLLFLSKELNATDAGQADFFVPLKDKNMFIRIARATYDRQAVWTVYGTYEKSGYRWVQVDTVIASFPETLETTEYLKKLSKLTSLKAIQVLEKHKVT